MVLDSPVELVSFIRIYLNLPFEAMSTVLSLSILPIRSLTHARSISRVSLGGEIQNELYSLHAPARDIR